MESTKTKPTTADILQEMLTESTGVHFLDSGGAQGRHWQRNKGVDFSKAPHSSIDVWMYQTQGKPLSLDICPTISVYDFLLERLDYEPELTEELSKYSEQDSKEDSSWMECLADWLGEQGANGPDRNVEPMRENTYNNDNVLSQDFIFTVFTLQSDRYDNVDLIAIEIHNGADARGGYTRPKIFSPNGAMGPEWSCICDWDRYALSCKNRHTWDMSDSGHPQHEDWDKCKNFNDYPAKEIGSKDEWVKDHVCANADENWALCPQCGEPLEVY